MEIMVIVRIITRWRSRSIFQIFRIMPYLPCKLLTSLLYVLHLPCPYSFNSLMQYTLGHIIPPILSYFLFATFSLGDLKVMEGATIFCFCQEFFIDPPQWGSDPKKCKFKVLANICCGYSNLVSQDARNNAKEIGSNQSSCPEKTSNMWSDLIWFLLHCAKFLDIQV